jgi:hypothetical protein
MFNSYKVTAYPSLPLIELAIEPRKAHMRGASY